MFITLSSLLSVMFLCSLLVIFIWFYLRDVGRIVQTGIKSVFMIIGFIAVRLICPFEFTFSDSVASRYFMPNILGVLHTPVMTIANKTFMILHIVFLAWMIGIIVAAAFTIKAHLCFARVAKELTVVYDSTINSTLHTIIKEYKKPVSFQVVYSSLVSSPMLYGCRHPKIIIPAIELTASEWHFVLKHEVSHYYNRDLQIKVFSQLLQIIYWWNPFIYLLNAEIDKMLEFRADVEVTKTLSESEKTDYLDCLLKVAKKLSDEKHNYYSIAFESGKTSVLSQRFHLILGNYKRSNVNLLSTTIIVISLILLLYFSSVTVFEPYAIAPDQVVNTVELSDNSSYMVLNSNGFYDIYINNSFFATCQEIKDSYSNLKVYHNLEEVPK